MNKPKTPPASASPQPLSLALPSPLGIQIEPGAKVEVTVVTPNKPPFKLNWQMAMLICVFVVGLIFWMRLYQTYVLERTHSPQPIPLTGTPLTVKVVHPARVAFGDEVEMDVVITNQGNDSFTGQVTIALEAAHPLPNETTAVKLENLGSRESKTHRLKFELEPKACSLCGGIVRASLQTYAGNRQLSSTTGANIPISWLPYARSLILWLRSSVLTGAVALLLWEMTRKLVFKWEAK